MKAAFLVASIVWALLLLPVEPAAAVTPPTPTIDLDLIVGIAVLDNVARDTLSMGVLRYHLVVAPLIDTTVDTGSLTLNGVSQNCTIDSVLVDCSGATLTCDDGPHDVTAGGPGVGAFDGDPVKLGTIIMQCQHPIAARRR